MVNYKKILKYFFLLVGMGIVAVPVYLFTVSMVDKTKNPFVIYWEEQFHSPSRSFIIEAFNKHIPEAQEGQTALILAADIAERDTPLPLKKGYNLIAFDSQRIYYDLMIPDYKQYKDKIKIVTEWDFKALPSIDVVMASFILPFYPSDTFKEVWRDLDEKIKPGGYFIGNFFDPRFEIFKDEERKKMSFYTKDQVLEFFKNYEVIKLEEVQKYSEKQKGMEYYYEVLARKSHR